MNIKSEFKKSKIEVREVLSDGSSEEGKKDSQSPREIEDINLSNLTTSKSLDGRFSQLPFKEIKRWMRQESEPSLFALIGRNVIDELERLRTESGIEVSSDELFDDCVQVLDEGGGENLTECINSRKHMDYRKVSKIGLKILSLKPSRMALAIVSVALLSLGIIAVIVASARSGIFGFSLIESIIGGVVLVLLSWGGYLLTMKSFRRVAELDEEFASAVEEFHRLRSGYYTDLQAQIGKIIALALREKFETEKLLRMPSAQPTLVEVDSRNIYNTEVYRNVEDLVFSHDAIALGVVGERGSGKSSLLEKLHASAKDKEHVSILLPVPSVYSQESFMKNLAVLVSKGLWREHDPVGLRRFDNGVKPIRPQLLVLIVCAVLFTAFAGLLTLLYLNSTQAYVDVLPVLTAVVAFIGMFLILFMLMSAFASMSRNNAANPVVRLAENLYTDLRFSWGMGVSNSASFKSSWLIFGSREQRENKARDLTYFEMSTRLRELLVTHSAESTAPVSIFIDELDKLKKSKERISLINVLKDIFHLRNVRVVVTLAASDKNAFDRRSFEADRGIFDTAFDDVIEIRNSSTKEMASILLYRVPEFPDALSAFCHCLALGNPRETIRVVRRLVQTYSSFDEKPGIIDYLHSFADELLFEFSDRPDVRSRMSRELVDLVSQHIDDVGSWMSAENTDLFEKSDLFIDAAVEMIKACR